MKPLILGMGPNRSHPADAWHGEALSTVNLCRLITGDPAGWPVVERHFELADLNRRWHRVDGLGDAIRPDEAEETLHALLARGALRSGRKVFLLGKQVTDFTFAWLRRPGSPLATDAWRQLSKCVGHRLRTDDADARIGTGRGFYDFVAIPVWHPRILMDGQVRMPPGWRQRTTNAMRAAAGLPPMRFRPPAPAPADSARRSPAGPQSPAG